MKMPIYLPTYTPICTISTRGPGSWTGINRPPMILECVSILAARRATHNFFDEIERVLSERGIPFEVIETCSRESMRSISPMTTCLPADTSTSWRMASRSLTGWPSSATTALKWRDSPRNLIDDDQRIEGDSTFALRINDHGIQIDFANGRFRAQ